MKVSIVEPEARPVPRLIEIVKNAKEISDASGAVKTKHKEYISNSYLSVLERELYGKPQLSFNNRALVFGGELHKRLLKPKEKKHKLSIEEEALLIRMMDSLKSDKKLTQQMRGAILERVMIQEVAGQRVKVILDIEKRKKSQDIKTTSCTSENQFLTKCREYHYFTQAWLYTEARKLKQFEFVAISKKKACPIFRVLAQDYPILLQEGEDRGRRLIEVYQTLRRVYRLDPDADTMQLLADSIGTMPKPKFKMIDG